MGISNTNHTGFTGLQLNDMNQTKKTINAVLRT